MGLKLHLDGARIFNASVALGRPVSELVVGADSVSFALSKGLSCPAGSLLAGSESFIRQARRVRKVLGGAMRQAGVLAAAGIVAFERGLSQLVEDHWLARVLAERLNAVPGLSTDVNTVETNIVLCDVRGMGVDAGEAAMELARAGIECAPRPPDRLRFVTHRNVSSADVEFLANAFERLGTRAATKRPAS